MIRLGSLLITLGLVACCGQPNEPKPATALVKAAPRTIEDDVKEFFDHAERRGVALPYAHDFKGVKLVSFSDQRMGYCDLETNTVFLDVRYDDHPAYAAIRTVIIWHEMLHCVGDLPHDNDGLMNGVFSVDRLAADRYKELDAEFPRVGHESVRALAEALSGK